jgi:hypothetical protein
MKMPQDNFDLSNDPPFTGISRSTARDLVTRYKLECQPLLTSIMPNSNRTMDARSIVFPIEQLKKMIWEIEHQIEHIDNDRELGLRMYYAKYPDIAAIKLDPNNALHKDLHNLPDDYSFRHTLVIVPTYKNEMGKDIDFDPWQANQTGVLAPMSTNLDDELIRNSDPMSAQMNHGNLSPPPFLATDRDNRNDGLSF